MKLKGPQRVDHGWDDQVFIADNAAQVTYALPASPGGPVCTVVIGAVQFTTEKGAKLQSCPPGLSKTAGPWAMVSLVFAGDGVWVLSGNAA